MESNEIEIFDSAGVNGHYSAQLFATGTYDVIGLSCHNNINRIGCNIYCGDYLTGKNLLGLSQQPVALTQATNRFTPAVYSYRCTNKPITADLVVNTITPSFSDAEFQATVIPVSTSTSMGTDTPQTSHCETTGNVTVCYEPLKFYGILFLSFLTVVIVASLAWIILKKK